MSTLLLGAIADDFTGATDLCNVLVQAGMRTAQMIGVPTLAMPLDDLDAVVIALKSRTSPPTEAVSESCAAADWLESAGAKQLYFKYCSTFDSSPDGNIGPVADALLDRVDDDITVVVPSFPDAGRTVYQGHLFVFDQLLSDSHMRDHPLTPMRDSNLLRVLGAQTSRSVALIPYDLVEAGSEAVREAIDKSRRDGHEYCIIDALSNSHLDTIAIACRELKLVTGGSALAGSLAGNHRLAGSRRAAALPAVGGPVAVIAGSCSAATLQQIRKVENRWPSLAIDPLACDDVEKSVARIVDWALAHVSQAPVVLYASAPADTLKAIQLRLGRDVAGQRVEQLLAGAAAALKEAGVRRFIVAGGETSGAVVKALRVSQLQVGGEIDTGVPWTVSRADPLIALALKSGNFGDADFFERAVASAP